MINEALGEGKVSHLMDRLPGINEPFIHCLHALTHGHLLPVRVTAIGLERIFSTPGLLARAELDLDISRIVLYRRAKGEDINAIWGMLASIRNCPADVHANTLIAADLLKKSGKLASSLGYASPHSSP